MKVFSKSCVLIRVQGKPKVAEGQAKEQGGRKAEPAKLAAVLLMTAACGYGSCAALSTINNPSVSTENVFFNAQEQHYDSRFDNLQRDLE